MIIESISAAFILGCGSYHITTEYEPKGGYNEDNKCLGIHAEIYKDNGWSYGLVAEKFKDSYSRNSKIFLATTMYNKGELANLHGGCGIGLGHVHTSYYDGAIITPICRIGYNAFDFVVSGVPKVPGGDAVITAQIQLRMEF